MMQGTKTLLQLATIAALTASLASAQQAPAAADPVAPQAAPMAPTNPPPPMPPRARRSAPSPAMNHDQAQAMRDQADAMRDRAMRDTRNIQIVTTGGMRGDSRIAPPGIWWKNTDLVQKIGLSAEQQRRMDEVFQNSRIQLIDLKANVEKQEATLDPLLDTNPIDTKKVLAQIGRVADARAELEKGNAAMLLGIRGVLMPDQWTKLQAEEKNRHHFTFGKMDMQDLTMGPDLANLDIDLKGMSDVLNGLNLDLLKKNAESDAMKQAERSLKNFKLQIERDGVAGEQTVP